MNSYQVCRCKCCGELTVVESTISIHGAVSIQKVLTLERNGWTYSRIRRHFVPTVGLFVSKRESAIVLLGIGDKHLKEGMMDMETYAFKGYTELVHQFWGIKEYDCENEFEVPCFLLEMDDLYLNQHYKEMINQLTVHEEIIMLKVRDESFKAFSLTGDGGFIAALIRMDDKERMEKVLGIKIVFDTW